MIISCNDPQEVHAPRFILHLSPHHHGLRVVAFKGLRLLQFIDTRLLSHATALQTGKETDKSHRVLLLEIHCTLSLLLSVLVVELNMLQRNLRATRAADGLHS